MFVVMKPIAFFKPLVIDLYRGFQIRWIRVPKFSRWKAPPVALVH